MCALLRPLNDHNFCIVLKEEIKFSPIYELPLKSVTFTLDGDYVFVYKCVNFYKCSAGKFWTNVPVEKKLHFVRFNCQKRDKKEYTSKVNY